MATDYRPTPPNHEDVELDDDLLKLVELVAENAHDVWAHQRMKDGWTFGHERCDEKKHHPCLVPFSELPESEKQYDRLLVLETVRAILSLGYEIKRNSV